MLGRNKEISLEKIIDHFKLEVLVEGDLKKKITNYNIHRVGYELTGFFKDIDELEGNINIIGSKETKYLNRICKKDSEDILDKYFSHDFPVLILSSEAKETEMIIEIARRKGKVVVRTESRATEFIRDLTTYLRNVLGKETIMDNCMFLGIYGVGVILRGEPALKIGTTVELLERGHKFITDKRLLVKEMDTKLMGFNQRVLENPERDFLLDMPGGEEAVNLTLAFGIKSNESKKKINLIIDLEQWEEKKFYDRLGLDDVYEDILGHKVRKLTLPARKGRNLAVIVETAAVDFRLRRMGVNSPKYFIEKSEELIRENKRKRKKGEKMAENELPISKFIKDNEIEILLGEENIEEHSITTTSITRPSMAFSGYFDLEEQIYENKGLQLITKIEVDFLNTLPPKKRKENIEKYFTYDFPAIISCGNIDIPEDIIEQIKLNKKILLKIDDENPATIIAKLNPYLEEELAKTLVKHGVFLEMYGMGVLITGRSGIGKSETSLELIHRGHRLVADDLVKFKRRADGEVIGVASKVPYFMEIRGLGIIDIKTLYGMSSVVIEKEIDAIIELKEKNSDEYLCSLNYVNSEDELLLGKKMYKAELYMSSGRNAAAMIEVAVMNLISKKMGHNSETEYERLKRILGK